MSPISKLDGVHPRLVVAVTRILHAMAEIGHPMLVVSGVRTTAEQQALYAQGRTKPGRKVTNADGVISRSNHQAKEDGFGHAVDMAFIVGHQPSWAEHHPWLLYGLMAETLGLVWGGRFTTLPGGDRPHVELAQTSIDGPSVGADVPGGGAS